MKRITNLIIVMILCLSLLSINVFAASPAVSATGPQEVEMGQTVQVQLKLTATDVYAMSGKISYDASLLQLESAQGGNSNLIVSLNTNNNKFTVYHIAGELLVDNTGAIVVLSFKVLDDVAGSVVFSELIATDGAADIPVGNATYSFTIAEPEPPETDPTEPKPTEPKPTEPKPTEPKPTEPKPTEPKPTEPKPTEPTTETTEPSTDGTQPSVEATEPSVEGTKPAEPAEPGDTDGDGEQKCCWWWILILIAILCCIWHLIVVLRKKKRNQQNT